MDVGKFKQAQNDCSLSHPKGETNALHAPSADRHDAKELVTRYSNCRNIFTSSQTSRIARDSDKKHSLVGYTLSMHLMQCDMRCPSGVTSRFETRGIAFHLREAGVVHLVLVCHDPFVGSYALRPLMTESIGIDNALGRYKYR